MVEFLELLSEYMWEKFPVWYFGWRRESLSGLDLLLALISDYFDGDMVIHMNTFDDPFPGDIEYRSWLAERQKV